MAVRKERVGAKEERKMYVGLESDVKGKEGENAGEMSFRSRTEERRRKKI